MERNNAGWAILPAPQEGFATHRLHRNESPCVRLIVSSLRGVLAYPHRLRPKTFNRAFKNSSATWWVKFLLPLSCSTTGACSRK